MTKHARSSFLLTTLVAAMSVAGVATANVTNDDIRADATNNTQVVTNGMGLQGQRFSTLDLLNTDNVSSLQPVWAFSLGGEKQRGQQSQPMIKDGVMYITGSYSRVFAVDARTGAKLWQYDARLPDGIMPCCDVINRGAALYDDLVIFGTLDAKLVALDQNTGKVVWKERLGDYKAGYSYTAAPLIVNGKVITGVSGGEFGIVGRVDARDPSRLINLGTAYARLGRTADAAIAYRSAIDSPIRYDLELANGDFMDSRWAARTALARLDQGRPLLALAH